MARVSDEQLLVALNEAWGNVAVTSGYDIVYSIGANSFHIKSSSDGQLTVKSLALDEVKAALASASTHIAIEDEATAYDALIGGELAATMGARKVRIEGDGSQLRALVSEMQTSSSEVMSRVNEKASSLGLAPVSYVERPEKADRLLLPDGVNTVQIATDGREQSSPPTFRLWDRLYFSTATTMSGNVGQGPYNPANSILDTMAKLARQTALNPVACTLMWGGVSGIGMRWKAFGSQDQMILSGQQHLMITLDEAATILRTILLKCRETPEWICDSPMREEMRTAAQAPVSGHGAAVATENFRWAWDERVERFVLAEKKGPTEDELEQQELSIEAEQCAKVRSARLAWLEKRSGESDEEEQRALDNYLQVLQAVENWAALRSRRFGSPILGICKEARDELHAICNLPVAIGGTWDGWRSHDLTTWDALDGCYTLEIELGLNGLEQFQVSPGRIKRWRKSIKFPTFMRKWTLRGSPGDKYKVKVKVARDGSLDCVETQALKAAASVTESQEVLDNATVSAPGSKDRQQPKAHSSSMGLDKAFSIALPGMKERSRIAVIEKLSQVEIRTLLELSWSLESEGCESFETKLKRLGEKDFAIRSLRKVCEELCSTLGPDAQSQQPVSEGKENFHTADGSKAGKGATVQVSVRHLTRGGSMTVDLPSKASVLDVRKAVMAKCGETNLAKVKIVNQLARGTKMIPDGELLGGRTELLMVGRPLQ